jgi:hypothetical protein
MRPFPSAQTIDDMVAAAKDRQIPGVESALALKES